VSTGATGVGTLNARRHASFVAFVLISSLAFYKTLSALVQYSLHDQSSSHIILIPFVSLFLLYFERQKVFSVTAAGTAAGLIVVCGALVLYWCADRGLIPRDGNWALSLETLAVILVWVGGYIGCYGMAALRAGAFSFLFLLLMVPVPDVILNWVVQALQEGSTDIAYSIFRLVGTPVLRHGFVLTLPGVTIEVAQECSSIRSSMALFITSLLAAHLYLRTGWKKLVLALLVFPLSLIKNGIRIATLTLLSIYVDPSFLTGSLHRQGGFAFFFLALLLILPVFLWMEKSDRRHLGVSSAP
jgi:exosortase